MRPRSSLTLLAALSFLLVLVPASAEEAAPEPTIDLATEVLLAEEAPAAPGASGDLGASGDSGASGDLAACDDLSAASLPELAVLAPKAEEMSCRYTCPNGNPWTCPFYIDLPPPQCVGGCCVYP